MQCKHFGFCGACNLYNLDYEKQLQDKSKKVSELIEYENLNIFGSPKQNYRARAELRIWHDGDECSYAMTNMDKNGVIKIQECQMVLKPIENRMWELLEIINSSEILKRKLFGVEFLSSTLDDVLVTMLYHKKLDDDWIAQAKELEKILKLKIIGRSRGQKLVLSKEYIAEELNVDNSKYRYIQYDGGFTQPNPKVNEKMISWAKEKASSVGYSDLLESYCGLGNFTLPLSSCFDKVLATEVSKKSIYNALENCKINDIHNISFIRLSSEEMSEALSGDREFNRLKDINLKEFNFSCVLVDPPRAGLDSDTIDLISKIEYIIYISCNPQTLARDLKILTTTHNILDGAVFDQFPYTNHIESGVFLKRFSK
jgi:tRNA (uracil-5-)-methyltransferase